MEHTEKSKKSTPLSLAVTVLRFDGEGSGTRESFRYAARYTEEGGLCCLSYEEASDAGGAGGGTKTVLSFKRGTPCVVKLQKNGEIETEMRFAEGERFSSAYAIVGLGSFDAAGHTRRVENSLTAAGGRLLLDYELALGGARARTVLTITAEEEKRETGDDACR